MNDTNDPARFAFHRKEFLDALQTGERELRSLFKGTEIHVSRGATLIEAGTDHKFVYRLCYGWMGRLRSLPDARSQFILVFLPGDFFAIKSMFMSTHPDDVVAISDSIVERIEYRQLHAVYTSNADVASRCLWQVMEEERRLHNWVVGLGQGNAEERVATLVIDLRGRLVLSGSIPAGTLTFQMPLTQAQIADHLGITAVHTNRILRNLRSREILALRDGAVNILDLDALVSLAVSLLDPFERNCPAYVARFHTN